MLLSDSKQHLRVRLSIVGLLIDNVQIGGLLSFSGSIIRYRFSFPRSFPGGWKENLRHAVLSLAFGHSSGGPMHVRIDFMDRTSVPDDATLALVRCASLSFLACQAGNVPVSFFGAELCVAGLS